MFCSLGMGLAQSSNYTCGSKGLPGFVLAKSFLFCYVTEDKIIRFSLWDCQHHAKGSTGAAAAPAGINDGLCVGRQPRACPQILDPGSCSWGHKPQPGRATLDRARESWGLSALHKVGAQKTFAEWKYRGKRTEAHKTTSTFTDSLTHSCIHSYIHSFSKCFSLCVGKALNIWGEMQRSQPGEPSHVAHI